MSENDIEDESAYVPALEAAGYVLRIREPDWYEHRMFRRRETNVTLHVFSRGGREYANAKTAVVEEIVARARAG